MGYATFSTDGTISIGASTTYGGDFIKMTEGYINITTSWTVD